MRPTTYLEAHLSLEVTGEGDPEEAFLSLAEAFHELPDRTVRDIAFDISTREATMAFTFEGRLAPDEAIRRAMTIGRTAFHTAGMRTDNDSWELARWSIVPSETMPLNGRAPQPA